MDIYKTVYHLGFNLTYYINDCMAENSIGKNEIWEPHMIKFVEKLKDLYNIKNIIDVGANFGYNSIFFSKIIGEDGLVFSFEPQSQNYNLLVTNINQNNISNIKHYNYACLDKNINVSMPIFELPLKNIKNMGDITPNYYNYTDILKYVDVKGIRLDSLDFPKIDLIKIDVQGYELDVINGLKNILIKNKPIIIIEFEDYQLAKKNKTSADLANLIRNNGYYIYYLEYKYPSDHICIHEDNLNEFNLLFSNYIQEHNENNNINFNINFGINKKIVI